MNIFQRIRRSFFWALYTKIGFHLPSSTDSKAAKRFRYFCAKRFLKCEGYCGKNVNIEDHAKINKYLHIGDNSGVGSNSIISADVYIGNNVMMGPNCSIYTQNHCFSDTGIPMIEQGATEIEKVFIDDDVWIGVNVTILPGVRISKGTVVGAGAVVTKSFPPFSVIGGNPAKIIKTRIKK